MKKIINLARIIIMTAMVCVLSGTAINAEGTQVYTDEQTLLFYNYANFSHQVSFTTDFIKFLQTAKDGDVLNVSSTDGSVTASWTAGTPFPNPFPYNNQEQNQYGLEPTGNIGFNHNGRLSLNNLFYQKTINCTIDLSAFDMTTCTGVDSMFYMANLKSANDIIWWTIPEGRTIDIQNMFRSCSTIKKVDFSSWGNFRVSNIARFLDGASKVEYIDLSTIMSVSGTNWTNAFAGTASSVFDLPIPLYVANNEMKELFKTYADASYITVKLKGEVEEEEVYNPDNERIIIPMQSSNYAINNNCGKTLVSNGVTMVNNDDGTVSCTGTCTGNFTYYISSKSSSPWTAVHNITIPAGSYCMSGAVGGIGLGVQVKGADGNIMYRSAPGTLRLTEESKLAFGLSFSSGTTYNSTFYPLFYKNGNGNTKYVKGGMINYFSIMKQTMSDTVKNLFYNMNINPQNALVTAKTPMFTYMDDGFTAGASDAKQIADALNIKMTFAARFENIDDEAELSTAEQYYNEGHQFTMMGLPTGFTWDTQKNIELGLKRFIQYMKSNNFLDYEYVVCPESTVSADADLACKNYVSGLTVSANTQKEYNYNAEGGKYNVQRLYITSETDVASVKTTIDTVAANGGWVIISTASGDSGFDREKTQECLEYAMQKGLLNVTYGEAMTRRAPIYNLYDMYS